MWDYHQNIINELQLHIKVEEKNRVFDRQRQGEIIRPNLRIPQSQSYKVTIYSQV